MTGIDPFWAAMIIPIGSIVMAVGFVIYAKYEDRIWKGKPPF